MCYRYRPRFSLTAAGKCATSTVPISHWWRQENVLPVLSSLMAAFAENMLPMPPISSTAAFADYVLPILSLFLNDGGICKCQSGGSAASTSKGAKTYILAKYFHFFLFTCIFLISWDFYRDYTSGLVKTVILQESEVLRSFIFTRFFFDFLN